MDLADLIERNAAFAPDKPALRFGGAVLTYADLARRIAQAARALKSRFNCVAVSRLSPLCAARCPVVPTGRSTFDQLPSLYFCLHGLLILVENALERRGTPINRVRWVGRVWTLTAVAAPLLLVFHPPFLKGVVWPLIGME